MVIVNILYSEVTIYYVTEQTKLRSVSGGSRVSCELTAGCQVAPNHLGLYNDGNKEMQQAGRTKAIIQQPCAVVCTYFLVW